MPILLHGGVLAESDPVIAALSGLVGLPIGSVAIVATNDPTVDAVVRVASAYALLGACCRVLDLRSAKYASASATAELLNAADIVHLTGGSAPVIADVLRASPIQRALAEARWLVAESGAAMALGAWALGCPDGVDPPLPGLRWLSECILDAHFDEPQRRERVESLLTLNPSLLGVGIEEATALVVEQRDVRKGRVVGVGQVHLLGSSSAAALTARLPTTSPRSQYVQAAAR